MREVLSEAGSLRYAALVVEVYRRQTLRHLAEAEPRHSAGAELRALLEEATLLSGVRKAPVPGPEMA